MRDNWDAISEIDQILVPTGSGYRAHNILTLMSEGYSILESSRGFGMAQLHFIDQRGPYQDGSTPLDMRYDARTIQIVINNMFVNRTGYFDNRWRIVDLLRPSRSFGVFTSPSGYQYPTTPLVYRKWLPAGKTEHGTDAVTTSGSATITSASGKFIHNGLVVGMAFEIRTGPDAGIYHVTSVENDYTIMVNSAMTASATNVHWKYKRGKSLRDLYCLLEQGPSFDGGGRTNSPAGYSETLRFIAHDPFWYGSEQSSSWLTPTSTGGLVFDFGTGPSTKESGAWFGFGAARDSAGAGRWLFNEDFVSNNINVIYWGHEIAYPIITIDGPATDAKITNTSTGVILSMSASVALGQTVVIDTLNLTVIDNFGNDLYQYLSGDLSSFSIAPDPQAPNRINVINASYADASSSSAIRLSWKNKYVSL
jgi:hypothetical protein